MIRRFSLKEAREYRNLSQKEMAEAIGVCQRTYKKYEENKSRIPCSKGIHICQILNFEFDLIDWNGDNSISYTNTEMLLSFIEASKFSIVEIANMCKISLKMFLDKLNGNVEFMLSEIYQLTELLNLTSRERDLIFFSE